MRLASVLHQGAPHAARLTEGGQSAVLLGRPGRRRAPRRPRRHGGRGRRRRDRGRCGGAHLPGPHPAGQGGLRRPQLPRPRRGDRPRAARLPDPLRQVHRQPLRTERRHPAAGRLGQGRLGGGADRRHRAGGAAASTPADALDHVAGYTVANDTSMRDWQMRTLQWLQGKNFEASTPVGPVLVTPDEIDHASDLRISCTVNDEVMQDSRTSDLIFPPDHLIAYISTFTTLRPGRPHPHRHAGRRRPRPDAAAVHRARRRGRGRGRRHRRVPEPLRQGRVVRALVRAAA